MDAVLQGDVGDFGGFGLDIGIGVGEPPRPVVQADPATEYVAGTVFGRGAATPYLLAERPRGEHGWHGFDRYQEMLDRPAAGAAFNALRCAVLAGGTTLLPPVKPALAPAKPGQEDGSGLDVDMAAEIADSNRRTVEAWATPLPLVLWEAMEAMVFGHKLAEVVVDDVVGGPDDGLVAIKAVKFKPRPNYRFRVDRGMNVLAIEALGMDGAWAWFDPDHFAWLTWDPPSGDPRGRSIFRMAYPFDRMLHDLWPEVWKGWKQFGVPSTFGTTAPNPRMVPLTGKDGQPIAGRSVTAEYAMNLAMERMRNGATMSAPNGSDIKVVESTKDSTVVAGAVSILKDLITQSILLQVRATTEAKHGSKADSETGQDIMGTIVRFVRMWLERWIRGILRYQNTLNYGVDVARRLTPLVSLGDTEHQDFAANAAAVATLYQSNYFTEGQLLFTDTFIGLPQRQAGEPRVGPAGISPVTPPAATADPNAAAPPADPNAAPAGKAAA